MISRAHWTLKIGTDFTMEFCGVQRLLVLLVSHEQINCETVTTSSLNSTALHLRHQTNRMEKNLTKKLFRYINVFPNEGFISSPFTF